MDQAGSIGSRIKGSASALMTDCFSKISPSAATSILASASRSDGKLHSLPAISDSSTLDASSKIYSPRDLDDGNGVHLSGEQGFRTRPSQSGCYNWGQQWAFEMFTSGRGTSYPEYALGSRRLLEHSVDQLKPERPSWSTQGDSQKLGSNRAWESSRSIDGVSESPYELSDGAAVVALLSSPNFAVQSLKDGELNDETDHDQNRYQTPQFKLETNAELGNLAAVHPLYLLPKLNQDESDISERDISCSVTADTFCARTSSNPPSASDVMQPWICLNNTYLVDVWDVLGLAERKVYPNAVILHDDVEVLGQECSAMSRLAMIRKHIDYLDRW